jgi:hypothetical protein
MEMIEEIGILLNQFLAFIQLADQEDNNFIEQIVRRRRRDILRRLLERHRVVFMRVEENRGRYITRHMSELGLKLIPNENSNETFAIAIQTYFSGKKTNRYKARILLLI